MDKLYKIINNVKFEIVWSQNRKGQQMINNYMNATKRELKDCYGRPSGFKKEAFRDCMGVMEDVHGEDNRITYANGWVFSFAFRIPNQGLAYLTKDHWYIII